MIDMKLDAKPNEKATLLAEPEEASKPEYPYGLAINLDNETLAKLGITDLPAIDTDMKLVALVCVTSVSQNETQGEGEPYRSVTLQIEQMELTPAKEEAGEGDPRKMYSKSSMNA